MYPPQKLLFCSYKFINTISLLFRQHKMAYVQIFDHIFWRVQNKKKITFIILNIGINICFVYFLLVLIELILELKFKIKGNEH